MQAFAETAELSAHGLLLAELQAARQESDRLFGILKTDALYDRPIAERHRVIFYLGHLDGFDSIQICREGQGIASIDPSLDDLFQAGIDPDSSNLPVDTPADWPSINEVRAYVERCRDRVDRHFETASVETVSMALEHRLMHLETLAYMFHNFDFGRKESGFVNTPDLSGASPINAWCDIPAGEAILGKPENSEFGWDNEFAETRRRVNAFRVQKYSITNGEYLRFVEQGAAIPHFWRQHAGGLLYRGMFGDMPLPLDFPVYVTQQQAQAYASWKGWALPTEEQFHRAAYQDEASYPWGNGQPERKHGNFDFERWAPVPVTATPAGDSPLGVSQLVGNGWQWTSTVFAPFPGFHSRPSYPGYSANFFDGQHYVLKGGSCRTAVRLLRRSFRNWFRSDYPYVYAAFRCVEN